VIALIAERTIDLSNSPAVIWRATGGRASQRVLIFPAAPMSEVPLRISQIFSYERCFSAPDDYERRMAAVDR
jgi:hypothetical protein